VKISVVSPVYNEEACVPELCRQLIDVLEGLDAEFEIILVDDGSKDRSWQTIRDLSQEYPSVKGLRFSRNFGHHYAITAGLDYCSGDWVVVMDSDLQDAPSAIPLLLAKAREGFDVVLARRMGRKYGWLKNFLARWFYKTFRYLTRTNYDDEAGVFRILSRRAVGALRQLPEVDRFFPAMVDWIGFPQSHVYVHHGERYAGETKYPIRKQITLAVNAILSFSERPLEIIIYCGLVTAALSFMFACYIVLRRLFGHFALMGYASTLTAISFFGGATIATLGVVGLYIGRILRQVKGRPTYIIAEESVHSPFADRASGQPLGAASRYFTTASQP
jgi:dolichol-phosphate mannosyltransferase